MYMHLNIIYIRNMCSAYMHTKKYTKILIIINVKKNNKLLNFISYYKSKLFSQTNIFVDFL
jgi:hypothetical protein